MPAKSGGDVVKGTRRVFTKAELLKFRDCDICCCRPDDLPDMSVSVNTRGGPRGGGGGGGRGQWGKESLPNHGGGGRRRQGGDGEQWARNKVSDVCELFMFSTGAFMEVLLTKYCSIDTAKGWTR